MSLVTPGTLTPTRTPPGAAAPFDWATYSKPTSVAIGELVPHPPQSTNAEIQAKRDAAWRADEEAAANRPAIGKPYADRPDVKAFFRDLAASPDEAKALMSLVEKVAVPVEDAKIPPSPPGQPDTRTAFEKSIGPYVRSGNVRGVQYARDFGPQVDAIANKYGIDAAAIYGTLRGETNMGGFTGGYNAFQQLVRGAFDGSRQEFFRNELAALVRLHRQDAYKHWDLATLAGSSAGALGWCQFMPTNLERLGDGRDPFNPVQAAELAAIYHQQKHDWITGQPAVAQIQGPAEATGALEDRKKITAGELRALGLTLPGSFSDATQGELLRVGSGDKATVYFSGPNAVVLRHYNWGEPLYGARAGLLGQQIVNEAVQDP